MVRHRDEASIARSALRLAHARPARRCLRLLGLLRTQRRTKKQKGDEDPTLLGLHAIFISHRERILNSEPFAARCYDLQPCKMQLSTLATLNSAVGACSAPGHKDDSSGTVEPRS